jgi:hypothetical protein
MSTLMYVATHAGQPTGTALTPEAAQREALRTEKQTPGATGYDYHWFARKTGEWQLLRKPKGARVVPAEKTARKVIAVAFTPDEKTVPVDGPFPIRVGATPSGAELDVSSFLFKAVFTELISKADDDPMGLVAELADMTELLRAAAHGGRDSQARHEFDERMQQMLKEFANDGMVPVYGAAVGRMALRLGEIAALRPVPGQRSEGNAA